MSYDYRTLTVADLIRALSKLPQDAVLYTYEPYHAGELTREGIYNDFPMFFQQQGVEYGEQRPVTPDTNRLCFERNSGMIGELLDFSEDS